MFYVFKISTDTWKNNCKLNMFYRDKIKLLLLLLLLVSTTANRGKRLEILTSDFSQAILSHAASASML